MFYDRMRTWMYSSRRDAQLRNTASRNKRWHERTAVTLPLLIGLVVLWAAMLFLHPYFHISRVITNTNGPDSTRYATFIRALLTDTSLRSRLRNNYFFANTETFADAIAWEFPVSYVHAILRFPGTIEVTVGEKQDTIFVYHGETLYRYKTSGVIEPIASDDTPRVRVLATSTLDRGERMPVAIDRHATAEVFRRKFGSMPLVFISDERNPTFSSSTVGLFVEDIQYFATQVQENVALLHNARLGNWYFFWSANEAYTLIMVADGWQAFFDRRDHKEAQIDGLRSYIVVNPMKTVEYIDLRSTGKAFVKKKNSQ